MSFATCHLCLLENADSADVPLERIFEHLREVHGVDVELMTWPDGEPVVVDDTLEPEDFA